MSAWDTQSGMDALAARRMDRQPMYEALHAAQACYQCGQSGKPGTPIGRRDWLCDDCHAVNEKRYRDEYGDEPLAAWQAEGR